MASKIRSFFQILKFNACHDNDDLYILYYRKKS